MHTVIFAVEIPLPQTYNEKSEYNYFLTHSKEIAAQSEEIQSLHQTLWQIPLQNALPFLVELVQLAKSCHYSYKVLYLEKPHVWMVYPATN